MVKMVEIACPRCSSTDVGHQTGDHYECNHCHTKFVLDRGKPRVEGGTPGGWGKAAAQQPSPDAGAQAAAVRRTWIIPVVAAVLILGLSAAIQVITSSKVEDATRKAMDAAGASVDVPTGNSAEADTPMAKGVTVSVVEHAKAELQGTLKGEVSSTGAHYWLTTYVNTGESPIERPAVVVSLFDDKGARVGEQAGWAEREVLEPGESAPVLVMSGKPPNYTREEVEPRNPSTPRFPSKQVPVVVTEQTVQPTPGSHREVVGTLKNERENTLKFIKIVAVGRDADDKLVSYATSFATKKVLAPGQHSGFKVRMGTFELSKPVRYELVAMGRIAD